MKTFPMLLLVMLASTLSACNNTEQANTTQQSSDTGGMAHDNAEPTLSHQPEASSPFIKVSNALPTTGAPTVQEIRAVLSNDIVVKTMPINFIYPNASLIITRGRVDHDVFSLRLIAKPTGEGLKQHFLRRIYPEGSSPEFPVIFTMNADQDSADELVVLIRWHILHRGLGINANLYQPLVFDNVIDPTTKHVRLMSNINQVLGEGYDGQLEQRNETYAYKDKTSLQRRIDEIRVR